MIAALQRIGKVCQLPTRALQQIVRLLDGLERAPSGFSPWLGAKNQYAVELSFAFAGCRNTTVLRGESHYSGR